MRRQLDLLIMASRAARAAAAAQQHAATGATSAAVSATTATARGASVGGTGRSFAAAAAGGSATASSSLYLRARTVPAAAAAAAPPAARVMSTLSGSGFGGGGGILAAAAAAARRPKQPHQQQTRALFIQTQTTPNPQSLMFVPGQPVLAPAGGGGGGESGSSGGGGSPVEFSSARAAAAASPLARRLFAVDGVSAVFFGSDFITVTKAEDASWATLKPDLFAAISDHYASGEPTLSPASAESEAAAAAAASGTAPHPDDDEVVAMIKELLETRIRPAVREDGGDIVFRSWDAATGTVSLRMAGACSGCPSSAVTLKSGIENMLMHYVPEVKEVVEELPDDLLEQLKEPEDPEAAKKKLVESMLSN